MTPPVTCVAQATPLLCPKAPVTTQEGPPPAQSRLPSGAAEPDPAPSPNTDPVALLAEAVDQLRLAVAALQPSTFRDSKASVASNTTAADKDRRISALAEEIRETQSDVGALLASHSFEASAPGFEHGPLAASQINVPTSPFGDASYSDAGGFLAEQTSEPDF